MRRYLRYSLIGFLLLTTEARADLPQEVTFDPIDLQASDIGHGWRKWDGLIRLNAQARRYCERRDDDNQKDGTEFSFFGPEEMGVDLVRVVDLALSAEPGVVWALIQSKDGETFLARFDGEEWEVLALADQAQGARSVNETWPEEVLIGSQRGLFEVDWPSQRVEKSSFPGHSIWKVEVTPGGSVFVAANGLSGFRTVPATLYELP